MYTLTASKTLMIYSESMISLDFKSYPQMMGVNMNKLWDKAVEYCLTHDDIEIFLLACCWAFLGWMMFHAVNGIMERIYC
jgi:hypothetical protein